MVKQSSQQTFSNRFEKWLASDQPKTVANLSEVFEAKSFATVILLLMFIPALPIPTGGITHVFEIIVMLLALEMMAGFKAIWLPEKLNNRELTSVLRGKVVRLMLRRIRQFEGWSSRRGQAILQQPLMIRFLGLTLFMCALTAFLSPPFSGLDTFPSLAAIIICLGIILEDAVLTAFGVIGEMAGFAVIITIGSAITKLFHSLVN